MEDKNMLKKISISLLHLKYHNKFLDFQEGSQNPLDPEKHQALLKKAGIEILTLKDYLIFKQFDKGLSALLQAKSYLQSTQNQSKENQVALCSTRTAFRSCLEGYESAALQNSSMLARCYFVRI